MASRFQPRVPSPLPCSLSGLKAGRGFMRIYFIHQFEQKVWELQWPTPHSLTFWKQHLPFSGGGPFTLTLATWSEWGCHPPTIFCLSGHKDCSWNAHSIQAGPVRTAKRWRAGELCHLKGSTVKTGPQALGAESQSFFHGLLINSPFCLLSQFPLLSLKTKTFNCQGSKKHRLSELLDPIWLPFFPTEMALVLIARESSPGWVLKSQSDPNLRTGDKVRPLRQGSCEHRTRQDPEETTVSVTQTHSLINKKPN